MGYLQELQNAPEAKRQRTALVVSVVVTVVIALVWIATFSVPSLSPGAEETAVETPGFFETVAIGFSEVTRPLTEFFSQ